MISFQEKNVTLPVLDYPRIDMWLGEVADSFDKKIGNINYIFCDDIEILKVNREFLSHDYFTDIITFDYSNKNRLGADIFISLDTVKSNAESLGVDYKHELLRVIVHGLLHLCGIKDKSPEERAEMEENENKALKLLQL